MVVVPVMVTARTKFLIQLNTVPVAVGMAIGVVDVIESAKLNFTPPSALAQLTDAPVPAWAWQVAADI
jgi:hypothetical protein